MEWNHEHFATLLAATAVLLLGARLLGEIAQRLGQAAVLGEITAGILLGPTVLGALSPGLHGALFPSTGPVPVAMEALGLIAITLFLLVAGMEIDLSAVWRQGKAALWLSVVGIAAPFAAGFFPAWQFPELMGASDATKPLLFALFFATAMSITALPVLAKILFDLKLLRSDLGVVLIAAAIVNDLAGWIVFVLVLSLMGSEGPGLDLLTTIGATLLFAGLMLTLGRNLLHKSLPFVQAHTSWPGGVLGFAVGLALLCAAFTEWLGVHAVFGSFLFGVALGDSAHLRHATRSTIERFVSFLFAPLFFASIGLHVNFVENFDLLLVVLVLLVATLGKVAGCGFAARWLGFNTRQSVAVGFGMNARGAMEIILGTIALRAGIIDERLFVALVIMALVTSASAGWIIQAVLARRRAVRIVDHVRMETFVAALTEREPLRAIELLTDRAAQAAGVDPALARRRVLDREALVSSALGNGLALPHARIPGLSEAHIAVGLAPEGIDFDAPDGQPVRVVLLMLTPEDDAEVHLGLLADVGRRFSTAEVAELCARASNFTEFRAFLNAADGER